MVRRRRSVDDFDLLGSMRERIVKLSLTMADSREPPVVQPRSQARQKRAIQGQPADEYSIELQDQLS